MNDYLDLSLEGQSKPEYYYKVAVFVTTFGKDKDKHDSYLHEEVFKEKDLLKCKRNAEKYYNEALERTMKEGKYFLPFAAPDNFEFGENAAFSITLCLVESYRYGEEYVHPLIGEDEQTTSESILHEREVLKAEGFL